MQRKHSEGGKRPNVGMELQMLSTQPRTLSLNSHCGFFCPLGVATLEMADAFDRRLRGLLATELRPLGVGVLADAGSFSKPPPASPFANLFSGISTKPTCVGTAWHEARWGIFST